MTSAVEYRIRRLHQVLFSLTALIAAIGAAIMMVIFVGSNDPEQKLYALSFAIMLFAGYCLMTIADRAIRKDGYCRAAMGKIRTLRDPPLDEWRAQLEEEGAFDTPESNVSIAEAVNDD